MINKPEITFKCPWCEGKFPTFFARGVHEHNCADRIQERNRILAATFHDAEINGEIGNA